MSFALYENMRKTFPNILWENSSMILEDLAAVKDESELSCLRTAVEITDKVYEETIPMLTYEFPCLNNYLNHLYLKQKIYLSLAPFLRCHNM